MNNILTTTLGVLPLCIAASAQQRMNVLFIAVDDLKPNIGCFGDSLAVTPHIDRIAKKGVVFAKNYCQFSWSAPSRASLLLGQTPDQTRIWDLNTKYRDKNPTTVTIPENFKNNGYYVAGAGKIYHNESVVDYDAQAWSEYIGYEQYNKYKPQEIKSISGANGYFEPEHVTHIQKLKEEMAAKGMSAQEMNDYFKHHFRPPCEGADAPDEAYTDGMTSLVVRKLLDKAAVGDAPFFIAAGFHRPHMPFISPKKYWDLYKRDQFSMAPFQQKAENSPDIAYHTSEEMHNYHTDGLWRYTPGKRADGLMDMPEDQQILLLHGYYAAISFVDAQIGKIYNHLVELRLADNTIVVIWGDHGWHLGDHAMWGKQSNFEQGARSPLLILDPRMGKRIVSHRVTEFVDIYPTLCDLTGIPEPHKMVGTSLRPLIEGNDQPVKPYSVSQYRPYQRRTIMGYTIRSERFRYTLWLDKNPQAGATIDRANMLGEEFYDYEDDPLETVSLVNDPKYRAEVERHKAYLDDYFTQHRYN